MSNTHMQFIIIISDLCIYNENFLFVCTWFRRKYQTRNEWFVFKPQIFYSVRYFTSLILQHPYTSTFIKWKLDEISGFETTQWSLSIFHWNISGDPKGWGIGRLQQFYFQLANVLDLSVEFFKRNVLRPKIEKCENFGVKQFQRNFTFGTSYGSTVLWMIQSPNHGPLHKVFWRNSYEKAPKAVR